MGIDGLASLMSTAVNKDQRSDNKQKIGKAATDFEALMVTQLLRAARAGGSGWLGSGEDQSSSTMLEMAEEFLSQTMASSGGLGMAKQITQGLEKSK
ncbi:MAG: hypothetical protein IT168_04180 [Bryobacterales bacterium]|nr:hypothetical protein [Bryobacterales bacterium]